MRIILLSVPLLAGCAAGHAVAPPVAAAAKTSSSPMPAIDIRQAGYWVWHEGELWRVRTTAAGRAHRFQGSVEGMSGGIVEVRPVRADLGEHVAQVGNTVQFDYDAGDVDLRGFDAKTTGGCLRFDLMVDGKRRPELVRFGVVGEAPARLPVARCP